MKSYSIYFRFLFVLSAFWFMQSCVEDDDFDVPEIPPIEEIAEIITQGGNAASFEGCVVEDFESYDEDATNFPAYENVATLNTRLWEVNEFAGNQYLRMSAFQATGDVVSYFVVPVNFDVADSFSFKTQDRFSNGDPLSVWIVTNYEISGNIVEGDFTEITDQFDIATGNTESFTDPFVNSGSYSLAGHTGNGFIAFKYVGNGSGVTTTMHIDDIEIVDNEDDTCEASGGGNVGGGNVGGSSASPASCLAEDFSAFDVNQDEFGDYEGATLSGDRYWRVREFDNNQYIEMSAFSGSGDYDAWFLVNVDFDAADSFSFKSKDGFNNGDPVTVLYSTAHTVGSTIVPADWTNITSEFTLATGSTSGFADTFTESGSYDLSSISGNGFIAFRYVGNSDNLTTSFQVDDITIIDNEDANCGGSTGGGDPTETSIADVRALFTGSEVTIDQNLKIVGVVTSDRSTNNINNRNLFFQDGSAGITVRFAEEHAFDLGKELEIEIQGIELSEFNGLLQLNNVPLANVTSETDGTLPSPQTVTIAELLTGDYESELIQIENVEFADDSATLDGSLTIQDCDDNTTATFISGGATFNGNAVPTGNGTLVGIGNIFNSIQIYIRDEGDLAGMTGDRCDTNTGGPTLSSISDIRDQYMGTTTNITGNVRIEGVVTSDRTTNNINSRNLFIQDGSAGIVVRFEEDHSFDIGQELEILVENLELSEFNGLMQINNTPLANVLSTQAGTLPSPQTVTVPELMSGDYEGLLVQLTGVEFADDVTTFNSSMTFQDCSGNMATTFISGGATFNGEDAPTGFGTLVGIASEFNSPQLYIRDVNDTAGMTGTRCADQGAGADFELIITGVIDGPLSGGTPKAIELYVGQDIADLSVFAIGSANNGDGTDGPEFVLSGSASAGDYIYIASEEDNFTAFFGFAPTFTDGAAGINGDDAVELFKNDVVIDVFGDINVDGTDTTWEYADGWAYRVNGTSPDGTTFMESNWTFSGPDALDGASSNADAATPFPIATYTP